MSTALTTKLERRITRLVDPAANRVPLTAARTTLGAVIAVALLAPIAGLRAEQVLKAPPVISASQATLEPGAKPGTVLAALQPAPAVVAQVSQAPVAQAASRNVEDDVMKTDEIYRLAKLNRDLKAMDRILADAFNETNQNGNSRDKAQTIELWKTFAITSLTTDTHQVQVAGNAATVTGTQTEGGTERMLFTRVYVKAPTGWQLLASMQFRNPQPSVEDEVMTVDEVYRLAKLNRDLKAMDRILADAFNETNQNGNRRNKRETIELWKSFSVGSLTTDTHQVRLAGDTAMVTGTQTEDGTRMLFTRVYVNGPTGWRLLASTQFRK